MSLPSFFREVARRLFSSERNSSSSKGMSTGAAQPAGEVHGVREGQAADALSALGHQRRAVEDLPGKGIEHPHVLQVLAVGLHLHLLARGLGKALCGGAAELPLVLGELPEGELDRSRTPACPGCR